MNIYVGNASPKTMEYQLRKALERYGKVDKISIGEKSSDGDTFSFCFVETSFDNQVSRAITEPDSKTLDGSMITVKKAEWSMFSSLKLGTVS